MYSAPPDVHMLRYSYAYTFGNLSISWTIFGTSRVPAMFIPHRHTNVPTTGNLSFSFSLVCFSDKFYTFLNISS
ncbi:MAG: hypothetical protein EU531_03315 [Promethearchaeota archaeon]|nr:MAG: hypothetical protein EU531_03315 [Candidatus Lokiarchaeota archaeon]